MVHGLVLGVLALLTASNVSADVYVDACATPPGDGSPSNPYTTVGFAVNMASAGATLVIAGGTYPESLVIDKPLVLTAPEGGALVGAPIDRLWAGANKGDLFDEPDKATDPDKTLGAMLDKLAEADLRVLRIYIDYRLELDDDGNPLPIGEYNDCILDAMDNLMVEARQRGILLLITLQGFNWIYHPYYMSVDHYGWRRCTTPANLYAQHAQDPDWEGGMFDSPYQQRIDALGWGNYLADPGAKSAYRQRAAHILNHRNPHLGNRRWKDINEVIWAWELFGEPEHIAHGETLTTWLDEMATYVKELDPNTYLALGTKIDQQVDFPLLDHDFTDADIYTMHFYWTQIQPTALERLITDFRGPQGIGGQRGKLLFVEEFNDPWRRPEDPTDPPEDSRIQQQVELFQQLGVPWMFWEYGYKFDDDDIWHGGVDTHAWEQIIRPHADNAWNTLRPCAGTIPWRVGEMVDALIGP